MSVNPVITRCNDLFEIISGKPLVVGGVYTTREWEPEKIEFLTGDGF